MEQFTEQERHTIDDIHKRNFQDMTPDEVQLYARWTATKAVADSEHQAKLELWREMSAARSAARKEQAALAKQNLKELKAAALARLAAIDGA